VNNVEAPSQKPEQPEPSGETLIKVIFIAGVGGLVMVALPYFTALVWQMLWQNDVQYSKLLHPQYGFSLLFILPVLQGFLAGWITGRYRTGLGTYFGLSCLLLTLDFVVATFLFKEGSICLILSAPLFLAFISTGLALGCGLSRIWASRTLHATLIPLVMATIVYDTSNTPPFIANAISDAVTIKAPPDVVWRYIVQYPENTAGPDYWLWQIGLPTPVQSVATGTHIGAVRQCKFTNGIAFQEQITELVPNKTLTFKVTSQPSHPEIIGHFSLDKGQLSLEANADGTTTVIATSWYRIFVRPSAYFDWWATDIVRHVHFRVLGHMKKLAETDHLAQLAVLH
jgi:uncharacterized protein YndB with AHSA1/START domain